MSLPGLSLLGTQPTSSTPVAPTHTESVIHKLNPNSEWRFEVANGATITVRLIRGTAELFGTELALNHSYTFTGTKGAIFTYPGCELQSQGPCEEYTAEETPMTEYANLHFALETIRNSKAEGPRVMVVGPNDSGKTSLVKILTAYAVRMGRTPVVVNTDPAEGMLSLPGSLSATVMSTLMDVEDGWGSSPTSGPSTTPVKLPLVYWLGLQSPEDDPKLFKPVCSRLALAVTGRVDEDEDVKKAGIIIDTSGAVSAGKNGYEIISHIAAEFSVNIIITIGSERLQSDLFRRFIPPNVTVLKLSKSGGCAERDSTFMAAYRQRQIYEYFFGSTGRTLSPSTQMVDFSAVTVFKQKDHGADALEASFLPGGEDEESEIKSKLGGLEKTTVTGKMMHSLVAVVYASPTDKPDVVRDASVMGFCYIADVNEKTKKVRILAPLSGKLGDRPLVWGRFPEAAALGV